MFIVYRNGVPQPHEFLRGNKGDFEAYYENIGGLYIFVPTRLHASYIPKFVLTYYGKLGTFILWAFNEKGAICYNLSSVLSMFHLNK